MHETGKGVFFTPAKFNTGEGIEETSIITATGPYVVEWNLQKLLRGAKAPYKIRRYTDEVKADDFQYGTNKNIIMALPHEVNMVDNKTLRRPTRDSIVGEITPGGRRSASARVSSGRIGGRDSGRYKLGKDDVVNSPY